MIFTLQSPPKQAEENFIFYVTNFSLLFNFCCVTHLYGNALFNEINRRHDHWCCYQTPTRDCVDGLICAS